MKGLQAIGFCLLLICFQQARSSQGQTGFLSIDCGATSAYEDPTTGISWVPDTAYTSGGLVANLSQSVVGSQPFQTLRYFTDSSVKKYCYKLGPVNATIRYLVRASFVYGNYDGANTYPIFNISVDASPWATVTILNASTLYFNEFIAVATSTSFAVCFTPGSTGSPFISTLELRPLVAGMYHLSNLGSLFLSMTARINFGAPSTAAVRYPDDRVDRIWVSDQVSLLQGEAPNTTAVNTTKNVTVTVDETANLPPVKVMQTAVVGEQGELSYRLNLIGYPANCYAHLYFAEIQDLAKNDVREFSFAISNVQENPYTGSTLNLARDVGPYVAFETGYDDVLFPSILNFQLLQTNASNLGPIVNALEIYQILEVVPETDSADVAALSTLALQLPEESAGDPCLPVSWAFLTCNSDSPPRVSTINLSGRNLTGNIPVAIGQMAGLVNLWLDNNQLTGSIPDLSALANLQSLLLQDNQLNGSFPNSLEGLHDLTELNVSENNLTGTVPRSLQLNAGLHLQAFGNPFLCDNLTCATISSGSHKINIAAVVGGTLGSTGFITVLLLFVVLLCSRRNKTSPKKDPNEMSNFPFQPSSIEGLGLTEEGDFEQPQNDAVQVFNLKELIEATNNFATKIGSGGYGPVYFGTTKDGQDFAVKVLSSSSHQGAREFFNEVYLLSRVHHRNLVTLIGYCPEVKERMLIYEYMHKGSLRDHLHGSISVDQPLDWLSRLKIVLDAAKGIEYLHTGCSPSIIHRDVKSSNILINNEMVAKVSDFGMSKLTSAQATMDVSTTVKGTVGYLDPEYYVSQQLTIKSDVFSFGVVLLEILSGREPLSITDPPLADGSIVTWARTLLQRGDVQSLGDPTLGTNFRMESFWKVAELALASVEPHGKFRPTMGEIVQELTEIVNVETQDGVSSSDASFPGFSFTRTRSPSSSTAFDSSNMGPFHSGSLTDSFNEPILR